MKYIVNWQTSIGVGCTFYNGKEKVEADNPEDAAIFAQQRVWERGFRDFSKSHIKINNIEIEK